VVWIDFFSVFFLTTLFLSSSCLRFVAIFADWDCSAVVFVDWDCAAVVFVDRLVSASPDPPSASPGSVVVARICRRILARELVAGLAQIRRCFARDPLDRCRRRCFDRCRRVSILSTRSILSRVGSIFSRIYSRYTYYTILIKNNIKYF
jgi:hypothetical protein